MNIVLFSQEELSHPLAPRDERAVHIHKVLHKTTGDTFDAGIIDGQAGLATITADTDEGISFSFTPLSDGKPLYPLKLIVGFPRPIQLKRLFRDAAGLGVSAIYLCGTELGEKSYMDSNIVEKGAARAALIDGTAQAKSTHVPALELYPSVKACLAAIEAQSAGAVKVMLDNVKPDGSLFPYMQRALSLNAASGSALPTVYASIGSERGWTDNERNQFKQAGFASCSMGIRVLRTETAATTAASLILQSMEVL